MATAPGPGNYTDSMAINKAGTVVRAQAIRGGARDTDGRLMHLSYLPQRAHLDWKSAGRQKATEIRFEPTGYIRLPWCGSLRWTGGAGDGWEWEGEQAEPVPVCTPQKLWLSSFVENGGQFVVPEHHSWIASWQNNGTAQTPENTTIVLTSTPMPTMPGTVYVVNQSIVIVTAWESA